MTKRTFSRIGATALAGLLVVAPVAGAVAMAQPAFAAPSVIHVQDAGYVGVQTLPGDLLAVDEHGQPVELDAVGAPFEDVVPVDGLVPTPRGGEDGYQSIVPLPADIEPISADIEPISEEIVPISEDIEPISEEIVQINAPLGGFPWILAANLVGAAAVVTVVLTIMRRNDRAAAARRR